MRDPQRIKRILDKLEQAWLAAPDLRLGQLVDNVWVMSGQRANLFNAEDDKMEAALDKWLKDSQTKALSPVDLRACKPGDKLRSKHGLILTYVGPNPYMSIGLYPHQVKYPNTEEYGDHCFGTRTDDGFVACTTGRLESDHDIVEIIGQ